MPYIDSEALKKNLFPYGMADNGNYGINAKAVMNAIETAPAVDAVEVVRCKDCRHSDFIKSCSKYECRKGHGILKYSTDFCGDGERKLIK